MARAAQRVAPANGAGANMSAAELELARRRKMTRERQQRYRAKRAQNGGKALNDQHSIARAQAGLSPAPVAPESPPKALPPPPASATFPVHETAPMAELAQPADRWTAIPPGNLDGLVIEPEVVAAPPTAGAHKVAGIAAALFAVTLEDAVGRFPALAATAAQFGVTDLDGAKAKAVAWAHATVLRTCAKHGFGISIPYEDEIASVAIVGGSLAYQWARMTGKLDPDAKKKQDAAAAVEATVADDDQGDDEFSDGSIRIEPEDRARPTRSGPSEVALW